MILNHCEMMASDAFWKVSLTSQDFEDLEENFQPGQSLSFLIDQEDSSLYSQIHSSFHFLVSSLIF